MAKNIAGSIRKLTLDGTSFDVMADTNITEVMAQFENDSVPTSGANMRKMTKRSTNREGIVVACNAAEADLLKGLAERNTDFPMSYETAAGDVYRSTGWIEFENRETEENRGSVKMFPRVKWTTFVG